MRYRLRTLIIAMFLAPPGMAVAWFATANAIAVYRARQHCDSWEDVGGPGAIDSFNGIICSFVVMEVEDTATLDDEIDGDVNNLQSNQVVFEAQ